MEVQSKQSRYHNGGYSDMTSICSVSIYYSWDIEQSLDLLPSVITRRVGLFEQSPFTAANESSHLHHTPALRFIVYGSVAPRRIVICAIWSVEQ